MPFTLAHPAAILPVARPLGRLAVPSALVIGSMAPDLPYFLPLDVSRGQSHSLVGLLWFCLPAGIVTYVLFHTVVKVPVLALLPAWMADRLAPASPRALPPAPWVAVAVSLLVGSLTHVIWDAFTHEGDPAVVMIPALSIRLFSLGRYPVFVYKMLQHLSTVLGLGALAWWSARWLRVAPRRPADLAPSLTSRQRALVVGVLVAAACIAVLMVAAPVLSRRLTTAAVQILAVRVVVSGMSAFAALLLGFCVVWQLAAARPGDRKP